MRFTIETIKPHTINKIEIINNYVDGWARKILGFDGKNGKLGSKGIIYIDCMSNAGMYLDIEGNEVKGTAIRVAKTLQTIIKNYPDKEVVLFFNDYDCKKIEALKHYLCEYKIETDNKNRFKIYFNCIDRDEFLIKVDKIIKKYFNGYNTLLIYDPYEATLNWSAMAPFINRWGEVIINHMVSDTTRGAKQARKTEVKQKYQETYQRDIEEIIKVGTDKSKLEKIVLNIIKNIANPNYNTYLASFPFFSRKNGLIYNLIFCTHHVEGIKLFKQKAWNAFGNRSSTKKCCNNNGQLHFELQNEKPRIVEIDEHDEDCYYIKDVADYIFNKYIERAGVSMNEVYSDLDVHPVFPTDGYKREIKRELKERYGVEIKRDNTLIFNNNGNK